MAIKATCDDLKRHTTHDTTKKATRGAITFPIVVMYSWRVLAHSCRCIADSEREREGGWRGSKRERESEGDLMTCLYLNQFAVTSTWTCSTSTTGTQQVSSISYICSAAGITISLMDCSVTGLLRVRIKGQQSGGIDCTWCQEETKAEKSRSPKNKSPNWDRMRATIVTNLATSCTN